MQAKNQLHPSHFPQVIYLWQRYCKLVLGTMVMPSYAHPNWYYQFIENFHLYLQAKSQLYPPCFSEDSLSAFWPINREQEVCQIWDWWWNINNIFILDHFQEKLVKLVEFSWKRVLFRFLNIPMIYHHVKSQKKLMSHFWEKCCTDGWTYRQQWFYRTPRRIWIIKP